VLGAFLCAATIEVLRPWRPVPAFALTRWLSNFALFLLAIGLNFLLVPVIAIAAFASLNSGMYPWVQLVVGVLALDALSYALHRAFHASPILWRFHALHHSDPELDVSTTVRHHPGEALLMAFAVGIVAGAVGLSPFVIGLYASLNLGVQFFAHANVGLPTRLANALAWLVVTPVLHRVHHSRHPADVFTNYGWCSRCGTGCSALIAANPNTARTQSSSASIACASHIFSGSTACYGYRTLSAKTHRDRLPPTLRR